MSDSFDDIASSHLVISADVLQLPEAVGVHGPRVPHEHRVPGSGQHRVGPAVGSRRQVQGACVSLRFVFVWKKNAPV